MTEYRGQIAIHSAKDKKPVCLDPLHTSIKRGTPEYNNFCRIRAQRLEDVLPHGCIVCVANLVDCVVMTPEFILQQTSLERHVGVWEPGRIALKLENIKRLSNPIPINRGWQSWGRTSNEIDELIDKDVLVHALSN